MSEVNDIWAWAAAMSRQIAEVTEAKRQRRLELRRQQYNTPYARQQRERVRAAKLEKAKEDAERERWLEAQVPDSCMCWQGHAPCVYCTDYADPDGLKDET